MRLPEYDPPETTILTTTWTCLSGHVEQASEDLGDPADHELVMRRDAAIRASGCRYNVGVITACRCGEPCTRTTSERAERL
jgi:hypothetical protein